MNILYESKFEPKWLRCAPAEPLGRRAEDWEGPFSAGYIYRLLTRAYGGMTRSLLEKLVEFSAAAPISGTIDLGENENVVTDSSQLACIHFLEGNCKFGDRCRNAHSIHAKRPVCRFFLTGGYSRGENCTFAHGTSHPQSSVKVSSDPLSPRTSLLPELSLPFGAKGWFIDHARRLLLVGALGSKTPSSDLTGDCRRLSNW